MKRLPAICSQERMMASDLDRTARPRCDLEARLDAAVHPGVDFLRLHRSIPREPENRWHPLSYRRFDRQSLPCCGVDTDTITFYPLPHARSAPPHPPLQDLYPTHHTPRTNPT